MAQGDAVILNLSGLNQTYRPASGTEVMFRTFLGTHWAVTHNANLTDDNRLAATLSRHTFRLPVTNSSSLIFGQSASSHGIAFGYITKD